MAHLYNRQWRRAELLRHVGRPEQLAGISALEASDGLERGGRVLHVWTGSGLDYEVLPDKGLDIAACRYQGMPLAWSSPTGAVHPAYFEPGGMGWLRSFQGGLFVTCGLDQFGAPAQDAGEALGLHGRAANLPARRVSYQGSWEGDDYVLEISGELLQARVFGENLLLRRRIRSWLGASRIEIEDQVTNQGYSPQPHMLLYHFNLGFPLISPESRLQLEAERTVARDEDAAAGLADWQHFQPPSPGYREQVFRHEPAAGPDGLVRVAVENPQLGLGLRLSYERAALPQLFQWKMLGEGTYVLGIEPANSSGIEGRAVARQRNDLPHLAPGESRRYHLELEIFQPR